jgi:formylglycine-generating enzyme
MLTQARFDLAEIEQGVCELACDRLGFTRNQVFPASRLLEDLHCDSLDLVELFMDLEETFAVTLPNEAPNPVYKAVFTRQPFRLRDLAELVYLQQGTGTPGRNSWRGPKAPPKSVPAVAFTQLGGVWQDAQSEQRLLDPMTQQGPAPQFRRRSDGMRCVLIPGASVEIGCNGPDSFPDEWPPLIVHMDPFLIDAEPVSTTAYCRFLNSVGPVAAEVLADWFVLDMQDDRNEQVLIAQAAQEWHPVAGAERWPMILVSWCGANAYSLWTNGQNWRSYRDENRTVGRSFLPTEAQWEYAARGARWKAFPWGDEPPSCERMRFGRHYRAATFRAETLPMADVNESLGMSPFGLHHMAGNVWQWYWDWYDEGFFQRAEARSANPVNRTPSKVRSERGGSWVGPAELCRSSYRRGRPPSARGRCLGFRCVSSFEDTCELRGRS